jgi:hypothetical protein
MKWEQGMIQDHHQVGLTYRKFMMNLGIFKEQFRSYLRVWKKIRIVVRFLENIDDL